jgi:hypothetical protein
MKKIQIDSKKIAKLLKKLVMIPANYFFWYALAMIFIACVIGGGIFYYYAILSQKAQIEIAQPPFQFQENLYQEVLNQWKIRDKISQEADTKIYLDPFWHASSNTTQ